MEVGTLSVETLMRDSAAAERKLIFDPTNLTDAIELSDDKLPVERSAI